MRTLGSVIFWACVALALLLLGVMLPLAAGRSIKCYAPDVCGPINWAQVLPLWGIIALTALAIVLLGKFLRFCCRKLARDPGWKKMRG